MKAALAILLVVAVTGFVECKPQLKQSLQTRISQLKSKRAEGEWPKGWVEFTQLIGKCESARNMFEAFNITLSEDDEEHCVLAKACPCVMEIGEEACEADEGELKEFSKYIDSIFPLLQCVNLEAVKETVMFSLYLNDKDPEEDVYLQASKPLFDVCEMMFDAVEEEEAELEKDLEIAEEKLGGDKRELQKQLKKLLMIASRKL